MASASRKSWSKARGLARGGHDERTRLADYENAIHEKTRLLLRVYPSNFTVTGFTEKPKWRT